MPQREADPFLAVVGDVDVSVDVEARIHLVGQLDARHLAVQVRSGSPDPRGECPLGSSFDDREAEAKAELKGLSGVDGRFDRAVVAAVVGDAESAAEVASARRAKNSANLRGFDVRFDLNATCRRSGLLHESGQQCQAGNAKHAQQRNP